MFATQAQADYRESARAQRALPRCSLAQREAAHSAAVARYLRRLAEKRAESERAEAARMAEWAAKGADVDAAHADWLARLERTHRAALDDFDALWRSPVKFNRFNRPSHTLSEMRVQEAKLLEQRRYEEATEVCRRADALSAAEVEAQHHHMLRQCLTEREAMLARQEAARSGAELADDRQRAEEAALPEGPRIRAGEVRAPPGAARDGAAKHRAEMGAVAAPRLRPRPPRRDRPEAPETGPRPPRPEDDVDRAQGRPSAARSWERTTSS
jgi:hypothetical protein